MADLSVPLPTLQPPGLPEGAPLRADFAITIVDGVAMATAVRLNGYLLPRVDSVSVEYEVNDVRRVVVEFLATSVNEVPE